MSEAQAIMERLAAADREHQKEAASRLLLRSVKWICAAILAAIALDVIFHLVPAWRVGILVAVLLGVLGVVLAGWYVGFVRRNRLEHTARLLESREPALGSRLINLLQLDRQTEEPSMGPLTRDLARKAVENYAAGLREVAIEKLARTAELRRYIKRAAWALAAFVAILAVCYRIVAVEAPRFADPFGDHPPYSFTLLEIVQPETSGTSALYGSDVIVKVKASGHQPKDVFLTSYPPGHPEQAVTIPMFDEGGTGYNQLLGNVRTDLILYAHTRDGSSESKKGHISVLLTPQLEKVFVRIAPPAYTGIQPEEKLYDFKGVQALEGSEVRFRLQSNRPLREGLLELAAGNKPAQQVALKTTGENEVTGSFIATDSGHFKLGVVDVAGLPSQGDRESGLTVTHDLPPDVHIANPPHDAFAAMDFKLQAQIDASDDYGLREIRFHRGLNGVFSAPQVFKYDKVTLDKRETADFNFSDLGIHPGDVITFFAEAVDNAPQPHLARSDTVRLQVVSVEDYNNYLREQRDIANTEAKYQKLNDDLQALADQQKQLGEEAQKLEKQLAEAGGKPSDALTQQLDQLIAEQNALNQKLNDQAARMEHFVRQNPIYDVEKDFQKQLAQEASGIRQSTKDDDDASMDVAQKSSPANGGRQITPEMLEEFKKASDKQVAALSQSHDQTDQQIVQRLDDMSQMQELSKDFNLFETLFHNQQEIAQQTQAYNRAGELDREDQLALKNIAGDQNQIGDTLGQLEQKLRDDADAAEKNFPKAAQSGRDLADQIHQRLMQSLATQATSQMLAGAGDQSFALADRLRSEMESLFHECQGGNCPGGDELDTYLRLMKLNPANNFAEMARSRKFGFGKGNGIANGQGTGMMGSAGYVAADGQDMDVLGNEQSADDRSGPSRQSSRYGKGAGPLATAGRGRPEHPDAMKGLNPVNRQSGASATESDIEEYNNLVDSYFKAITTKKAKPEHETSH